MLPSKFGSRRLLLALSLLAVTQARRRMRDFRERDIAAIQDLIPPCMPDAVRQAILENGEDCLKKLIEQQRGMRPRDRKAALLQCLADRLGIMDSEDELIEVIQNLTDDEDFIALWEEEAKFCLDSIPDDIDPHQKPVFILVCLMKRLLAACPPRDGEALCVEAALIYKQCYARLWFRRRLKSCLLQISGSLWPFVDLVLRQSLLFSRSNCQQVREDTQEAAACAMKEADLVNEEGLDREALGIAILDRDEPEYEMALENCPQTAVDDFVTCWSREVDKPCCIRNARRLARAVKLLEDQE